MWLVPLTRHTPAGRNGQADLKQAVRVTRKRAGEEELSIQWISSSTHVYRGGRVLEVTTKSTQERIMKDSTEGQVSPPKGSWTA